MSNPKLGLEGVFPEAEIPLPMRRSGMAEWCDDHVNMLDRRALPLQEQYLKLHTTEDVATAIETMAIQGAFSISIAAGYGLALSAPEHAISDLSDLTGIRQAADRLITTRPTGLAIQRMMTACLSAAEKAVKNGAAVGPLFWQWLIRAQRRWLSKAMRRAKTFVIYCLTAQQF
ncbi:MAG: hypothetical protein JKY34_05200 [Kordiimonadaceae bacterium]|nr:hypothetical protein [Kordiimonadaceae bacterium]